MVSSNFRRKSRDPFYEVSAEDPERLAPERGSSLTRWFARNRANGDQLSDSGAPLRVDLWNPPRHLHPRTHSADTCEVELPRVRRYRKGAIDRLYVEDADGRTYGWADAATGEIHVQIADSDARIEAALEAWALAFPEDDLAEHKPGRNMWAVVGAWDAEIDAIKEDMQQLREMHNHAVYQRDLYEQGKAGELGVGVLLNSLYADGWGVLHSIPVYDGRSDIDHLLVGPGGVWTVNAKSHGRLRVVVNGDRVSVGRTNVDYVRSARHEAALATRVLRSHGHDVPVYSAVALDLDYSGELDIMEPPEDVVVDTAPNVVAHLRTTNTLLDQAAINSIFATARKRTTWEA